MASYHPHWESHEEEKEPKKVVKAGTYIPPPGAGLSDATPGDTGASGAAGTGTKASRDDHRHKAVGAATPVAVKDTAATGTATLASREDHAHDGVSQIVAGTNITIDPVTGKGAVTINAAGGGGGLTKVELPFDGTYTDGQVMVTDTPALNKIPVAIYLELTTYAPYCYIMLSINNKNLVYPELNNSGEYAWFTLTNYTLYTSADGWHDYGFLAYAWKPGYSIAAKAKYAGHAIGKLIIYYLTIA